jgi:predicted DCC family thiol-disulfide oxidoreductase YuxK
MLSLIIANIQPCFVRRTRLELCLSYIRRMRPVQQPIATVYYDGACPVCSREIEMYRQQPGAASLAWVDVAQCEAPALGAGLTRAAAMARLHLRRADGSLVSGALAFTTLWQVLPRWAWAGRLLGRGPGLWLLEAGYRLFLVLRRTWRQA